MRRESTKNHDLSPAAVTEREAARYLGVSPDFLRQSRVTVWRKRRYRQPHGPSYIRIGVRGVRYRIADLDAWLAARVIPSDCTESRPRP